MVSVLPDPQQAVGYPKLLSRENGRHVCQIVSVKITVGYRFGPPSRAQLAYAVIHSPKRPQLVLLQQSIVSSDRDVVIAFKERYQYVEGFVAPGQIPG